MKHTRNHTIASSANPFLSRVATSILRGVIAVRKIKKSSGRGVEGTIAINTHVIVQLIHSVMRVYGGSVRSHASHTARDATIDKLSHVSLRARDHVGCVTTRDAT